MPQYEAPELYVHWAGLLNFPLFSNLFFTPMDVLSQFITLLFTPERPFATAFLLPAMHDMAIHWL
jgi:hypothetical protein